MIYRLLLLGAFLVNSIQFTLAQCWEVRDQALNEVLEHLEKSNFDSLTQSLIKWGSKCDKGEALFRLSVLNAIQNGQSIDTLLDENTIGYIRSYETNKTESLTPYYHSVVYTGTADFDELLERTQEWAGNLRTEDPLANAFLNHYKGTGSVWKLFSSESFPSKTTQYAFDLLVIDSQYGSYLSVNLGGYSLFQSSSITPQVGFSLDRIKSNRYQGFGAMIRFEGRENLDMEFKEIDNQISPNGIELFYNNGINHKTSKVEYLLFGTVANTMFISEYAAEDDTNRLLTAFQLGIGTGIYTSGEKPNRLGLEIRYLPISYILNNEVDMQMSSISINLKYMMLDSRILSEFLKPIGHYR